MLIREINAITFIEGENSVTDKIIADEKKKPVDNRRVLSTG